MRTDSERILRHSSPGARAVLLFGSRARGDHRPDSDTDVLQILPEVTPSASFEEIVLSNYTFPQLKRMASQGSLFIAHLIAEAVPLRDPEGLLAKLRQAYRPTSLSIFMHELDWASRLLTNSAAVYEERATQFNRLALNLARTYVYATAQAQGIVTFSMSAIWKAFEGNWGPSLPRLEQLSWPTYSLVRSWLEARIGKEAINPFGSPEALVVNALGQSRLCVALGLRLLHNGASLPAYEATDLGGQEP